MTSTNIFKGRNEGRNSSRVLKPPGGGHTDILGLSTQPDLQQVKKPSPRNISSITEGTNVNVKSPVTPPVQSPVETPKNEPVVTPEQSPPPAPAVAAPAPAPTPSAPAPAVISAPAPAAPQRVRVPPGGFSSGLW